MKLRDFVDGGGTITKGDQNWIIRDRAEIGHLFESFQEQRKQRRENTAE
jgi:hypothetical protein